MNPEALCSELESEYAEYKRQIIANPQGIHALGQSLAAMVAEPFREGDPQFASDVARVYQYRRSTACLIP